jgi:hypothetical protein
MTLHRLTTDGGVNRGVRLLLGMPYGDIGEFGYGDGDGWDGSDADAAEQTSSAHSSTTITKTGAAWTVDEHIGKSVLIINDSTGEYSWRVIKDSSADTLTWSKAITTTGMATPTFYIGGIAGVVHLALIEGGEEIVLWRLCAILDDQINRRVA